MCKSKHISPLGTLSLPSLPLTIVLASVVTLVTGAESLHHEPSNDSEALLCLKLHLSNPVGPLASWNNSLPFCSWPGVTCSKRYASRVIMLDLGSLDLNGQIPPCISNLTFLTRIHFPNNQLRGQIPHELGQLYSLQYLNLRSNNFSGMIPHTLSSCSYLRVIDLGVNSIHGEIPKNLSRCLMLQKLNLDHNMLSGGIPEGLGMIHSLSVLNLATNRLMGSIPLSLGSSSSLTSVVLTNNSLTGSVPSFLANSSSLQVLSVANNHLTGEIPTALFNGTSLQKLVLAENNFLGFVPILSNVKSPLQYLILQSNDLAGTIPSTLGNFSSLKRLLLGDNNFYGAIPMSIGKLTNLQELGMGVNNLTGQIPFSMGYTLRSIKTLIMQGNQFHGHIPASLANTTNLQWIDLRHNMFSGIIPSFGTLQNLIGLNLGRNQLEAGDWSFLSSLTNSTQLTELYLDNNNLQGDLPSSIANLSESLEKLLLASNKISGQIPHEIGQLRRLKLLYMGQNILTGNLPYSLGNLRNLFVLSLSQNKLSGKIPLSISNLSQLSELYLQDNNFNGQIPGSLGYCKNIEMLNLSRNRFNGGIPNQLFTLYSLSEGLDLSHNKLSGQIPLEIGNLINLITLNISNNKLSGTIPPTLGECVLLESLHMEGNLLKGSIPESFTALRGVIDMDLSKNNLSGQIPEFFVSFRSMKLLNLSFNNLDGPIPTGGIFLNSGVVLIQGNKKLCSSISLLQLPLCRAETSTKRHTLHILMIVGCIVLSLIIFSCSTIILSIKKKKRVKRVPPALCKNLKKISYPDLVKATNGFSSVNLVGSGKYGSVYRGILECEEHAVAIKVFKLDVVGAQKSFLTECEALRNTRHRNLVKVVTACSSYDPSGNEYKALVLEYMPNGRLESWLHPNLNKCSLNRPLSLGSRILIAADIASSLDYLHNHCVPPMVHCDSKPSNVLLDNEMHARVGDFGLAKFLQSNSFSSVNSSTNLLGPRGSIGYIAPEYGFGSKISREGDVYGYGIIILELLTGKRPTDEMFSDGWSLHKYVKKALPQNIYEILDSNIIPNFEDEDVENNLGIQNPAAEGTTSCVMQLLKLGLSCSVEASKDRPTMKDVYAEVIAIKEEYSALHGF